MAKNIIFDSTKYSIDEAAISEASSDLQSHLSSVMNGSGAEIDLGGTTYGVDSTKLSSARDEFVAFLQTIPGSDCKVIVGGIEYLVDRSKLGVAIAALHDVFGGMAPEGIAPGLYQAGTDYSVMTASWDELIESNALVITDGKLSLGIVAPNTLPEENEYGFYYDVPYTGTGKECYIFHADGSADYYSNGTLGSSVSISVSYDSTQIKGELGDFVIVSNTSLAVNGDPIFSLGEYPTFDGDLIISADAGITRIGTYEFRDQTSLTSVLVPEGVEKIANGAFANCTNLKEVQLPDSLTYLGNYAFEYCNSLREMVIPPYVEDIYEDTFQRADNIRVIIFKGTPNSIHTNAFLHNNRALITIIVPWSKEDGPAIRSSCAAINYNSTKNDDDYEVENLGGDTLTWDGNTEGLLGIDLFWMDKPTYFRVSELPPPTSAFSVSGGIDYEELSVVSLTIVYHDTGVEETYRVWLRGGYGPHFYADEAWDVVIATQDTVNDDGFAIEKGIYFCNWDTYYLKSFKIDGYKGFPVV